MGLFAWLHEISGRALLRQVASGIDRLESHMTSIEGSLARLNSAVDAVGEKVKSLSVEHSDAVAKLQEALDAERQAAYDLKVSEDAEDVEQNRQLDEARDATNAAMTELQGVTDAIDAQAVRLGEIAGETKEPLPEEPDAPAEPDVPAEPETPPAQPETPAEPEVPASETQDGEVPAAEDGTQPTN